MPATVRNRTEPGKMSLPGSASLRPVTVDRVCLMLSERWGDSPATWANRMHGQASDYRQVARMNTVLCEVGMAAKVAELMAPVDASVECLHVATDEHEEAMTDAVEDVKQSAFRADPCVETARALLRCRAQMRKAALADDARIAKMYGLVL
jgi:hypothetical protein